MDLDKINEKSILNQKVGDILNEFPNTLDFFENYKIDYCCGGQEKLEKYLTELNLNNSNVLKELLDIMQDNSYSTKFLNNELLKSTTFISKSSEEITNFIVNHFHKNLREEFPKLNELTLKIMRVHIKKHKELYWKIHELVEKIRIVFEPHLILEEENIFKPMIKLEKGNLNKDSEEYTTMINSINESINEHSLIGPYLKELSTITNNFTPPQDACSSVNILYRQIYKLQYQTIAHTQIENNILFPRFLNS